MNRIDPHALPNMLAALCARKDVEALEWPLHVALVFHGGALAYFRIVDGVPPELVAHTTTPEDMHLPLNGLVVDVRGVALRLSFADGVALTVVH